MPSIMLSKALHIALLSPSQCPPIEGHRPAEKKVCTKISICHGSRQNLTGQQKRHWERCPAEYLPLKIGVLQFCHCPSKMPFEATQNALQMPFFLFKIHALQSNFQVLGTMRSIIYSCSRSIYSSSTSNYSSSSSFYSSHRLIYSSSRSIYNLVNLDLKLL